MKTPAYAGVFFSLTKSPHTPVFSTLQQPPSLREKFFNAPKFLRH
jgi:hypothetical protein